MSVARIPSSSLAPDLHSAGMAVAPRPSSLAARLDDAARAARTGHNERLEHALAESARVADSGLTDTDLHSLATIAADTEIVDPIRAQAELASGLAWEQRGEIAEATACVRRAMALHTTGEASARLAALLMACGDYASASQTLHDAIDAFGITSDIAVGVANFYLEAESVDEARKWLGHALMAGPDDPGTIALQVRFALIDEDDAALELARRLTTVRPSLGRALVAIVMDATGTLAEDRSILDAVLADPPVMRWAELAVGAALQRHGRSAEVISLYGRMLDRYPEDVEVRRRRGFANAVSGDFEAAWVDLEQVAGAGDSSDWLTALRGELALFRGDPETAVALLSTLDADTNEPWVQTRLGRALTELNRLDEARSVFARAVERSPEDAEALVGLANVELAAPSDAESVRPYGRAEDLLVRAREIGATTAVAHGLFGELLRRRDDNAGAIVEFDAALALDPGYDYARASKAQSLIALGDTATALDLLEQAVLGSPSVGWIVDECASAVIRARPDDADKQLRAIQRRIRADKGDVKLIQLRRIALAVDEQRLDDAERLYREVRATAPTDPELILGHARVQRAMGQQEDALATLAGLSDDADKLEDAEWERIDILFGLDRLDEARDVIEEVIARQGDAASPAWRAALGELRRLEGHFDEARRLLTQASEADPDSSYALASLGAVEVMCGNVGAARLSLERAIALWPGNEFAAGRLVVLDALTGNREGLRRRAYPSSGHTGPDSAGLENRVGALQELGDYAAGLDLLEQQTSGEGQTLDLMLQKASLEITAGMPAQAVKSLLLVDASFVPGEAGDQTLVNLPQYLSLLLRVHRWAEARAVLARFANVDAVAIHHASALFWSACGFWDVALRHAALASSKFSSGSGNIADLTAGCLRLSGRPREAVEVARMAYRLDPLTSSVRVELAECLLAAGELREAGQHHAAVVDSVKQRVYPDTDELIGEAWCLMRTGRTAEAAALLLRTLSVTDQVALVLFNLLMATLLEGDQRQGAMLVNRGIDEIEHLRKPSARGAAARARNDLVSIEPRLVGGAQSECRRGIALLDDHLRSIKDDEIFGDTPSA